MSSWPVPPIFVVSLGCALLHFLWQGTLVALAYASVRVLLGRALRPQSRYSLACVSLAAMVLWPFLTFLQLAWPRDVEPALALAGGWALPGHYLAWIVVAWLFGAAAFLARLAFGWRTGVRLCEGSGTAPPEWQLALEKTAARLATSRPVRLLISSAGEVPIVVGWVRPVILFPLSCLTSMPADQITALLAHELAHVRRLDYLANLIQSAAEALLFYHPAVWAISHEIRVAREQCCDQIVLRSGTDTGAYMRALAALETRRAAHRDPALAAGGGGLLERIRRMVEPAGPGTRSRAVAFAGAVCLVWTAAAIAASWLLLAPASEPGAFAGRTRFAPLESSNPIEYSQFLPSPEVLKARYGSNHTSLPNGENVFGPTPRTLAGKYARNRQALKGSDRALRHDALHAPLPQFPSALRAQSQGLVVIEVVISPDGRVSENLILTSFDEAAAKSVVSAMSQWRFRSLAELSKSSEFWRKRRDRFRIGRLGFEFSSVEGKGTVHDLAARANQPRMQPRAQVRRMAAFTRHAD